MAVAFVLVAAHVMFPIAGRAQSADRIAVDATPLLLDPNESAPPTIGPFLYRGGVELRSQDSRFGGLSGILVADDGARVTLVSDRGYLFRGRLVFGPDGALTGIADVTAEDLKGPDGRPLEGAPERDAEDLARAAGDGFAVSFEHDHRVLVYPDAAGRQPPVKLAPLPGVEAAPKNASLEAITRLDDGRWLVVSEGLATSRGLAAWIGDGSSWQTLDVANSEWFRPSGAATLPGGDVLLLERRFPPIGWRLRHIAKQDLVAGALVEPRELARFEGAINIDNMEGVDVRLGPSGTVLVYVVSDDNYSRLQRTLLMMFSFTPPG